MSDPLRHAGYQKALDLIRQCATEDGFVASPTDRDNYRRVWGRDGVIIGLAALLTGEQDLRKSFLQTLRTLSTNRGPHGEIPSNVDTKTGRVSYGGTAGRVDADLWFLIGCGAYWKQTQDEQFLDEFTDSIERVQFLLGAWEYNTRGLLYVPHTGGWSDEYMQQGYVLYDQLLYLCALRHLSSIYESLHHEKDFVLEEKVGHLRNLIVENYWFDRCDEDSPDVYHPILYKKGCEAAEKCSQYWLPFFSPAGYGYRFDAFANVLASLFGVASSEQSDTVDAYIASEVVQKDFPVLPAFHPVIMPDDSSWESLNVSFSYTFKNKPHEFHNGGLWPMITGFYVADLAKRGKKDLATRYAKAIDAANVLGEKDGEWGFHEFIHGEKHTPGGTRRQGWSAAGSLIAYRALENSFIL